MLLEVILTCAAIILIVIVGVFLFTKSSMPKSWHEFKFEVKYVWFGALSNIEDKSIGLCMNRDALYKQEKSIAVLTGGNRGLGLQILKKLLECDMIVILGVRNVEVAKLAVCNFIVNPMHQQKIVYETCDVGDMSSVREFARNVQHKFPKINLLINNAGILGIPYTPSKEGFEMTMTVNYTGHFLLTHLLMPQLIAGANELGKNSRVVNVSSCAHYAGKINYNDFHNRNYYHGGMAYSDSKFAQVLFTRRLNQLCKENNWKVQSNACHPGVVDTEIFQHTFIGSAKIVRKLWFKTPEQGARSIIYAAIDPHLENCGGTFISNCRISKVAKDARDMNECKKFFDFTCNLLNVKNFGSE